MESIVISASTFLAFGLGFVLGIGITGAYIWLAIPGAVHRAFEKAKRREIED